MDLGTRNDVRKNTMFLCILLRSCHEIHILFNIHIFQVMPWVVAEVKVRFLLLPFFSLLFEIQAEGRVGKFIILFYELF